MLKLGSLVLALGAVSCIATGGAAPPGSGPSTATGPIEAGCSFTGLDVKGDPGATFQVACPANCESTGGLWGTDVYTRDSAVCRTGIHAGVIAPGGGIVTIRIEPGRPAYRGSARHGIQSGDFGAFHGSYAVLGGDGGGLAITTAAANVIEAGCSYDGRSIVGDVGSRHVISCPAGCAGSGGLWGTEVYTGDSLVCRAGIHAGLISDAGGTFAVVLEPGQPAYQGTSSHGISSGDFAQFGRSFRPAPL